ncbi:helix-turn-helix transcriptional regulator [Actinoplanes couchii]|uniref:DNA-binding protein n=1 Tax=Actinoplanes couchii TaxID=403638 RepID=A0ABQ3XQT7_9ACTN|nr:helix-turn-helix transcriptional regulator [Actinoplanes couchii]MDR6318851.1 transcriptional regulator with XRE-family HTH domain [Actinoplanes couchii]GID60880.1 DNA-binding protein [Actinoplanes couchii]
MDDRPALGDFLRRRREQLAPAEAGLPPRPAGRTPGLRREEVAALATVSTTYYERLEQGRGPRPSSSVLAALAVALRLNPDEEAHVFRLAGHSAPARQPGLEPPDPGLVYLLEAIASTTPAFITDELGTVLAQNWLNVSLFGQFAGRPSWEANLVWHWFMTPSWRGRLDPFEQQEQTGFAYVSDLRFVSAQRGRPELVDRLLAESAEFRGMWERHEVAALHCSAKVVHDERVGRLDFDCSIVASPVTRQRMLTMQPVAGTPTAARLSSLPRTDLPRTDLPRTGLPRTNETWLTTTGGPNVPGHA